MITANPDLDMAQFMTVFNQVVELHSVHILAIAEREMSSINIKDLTMIDKDDVFDEAWQPSQGRGKGSDPNSGANDAQQVNAATHEQNQINYATQIQNLALSMFDGLSNLRKDNSESKPEDAAISTSPNQVTDSERDLKLARDCRELLQAKGRDDGNNLIFERSDGKGNYKFRLEKDSDTMTLNAKDRPANAILVESQGKVLESHVTDLDAANIARAVEMLNVQQSKTIENHK